MPASPLSIELVNPSTFTPPYDHALAKALARAGARVELVTSRFTYGDVPRANSPRYLNIARGRSSSLLSLRSWFSRRSAGPSRDCAEG